MAPLFKPQLGWLTVGVNTSGLEGFIVKMELDLHPVAVSVTVTV